MSTSTDKARPANLNIRVDDEFWEAVDALRRERTPLPSASELIRSLVVETAGAARKRKRG